MNLFSIYPFSTIHIPFAATTCGHNKVNSKDHIGFLTTPSFFSPMAEMSVTTASLQSFPKSLLCSLSTRKFNSSFHPSAILSPISRFCLISKFNSFRFSAAVVKAASSPHANTKEPMLPPYDVLITGASKG